MKKTEKTKKKFWTEKRVNTLKNIGIYAAKGLLWGAVVAIGGMAVKGTANEIKSHK